jgi:hypothetical protein
MSAEGWPSLSCISDGSFHLNSPNPDIFIDQRKPALAKQMSSERGKEMMLKVADAYEFLAVRAGIHSETRRRGLMLRQCRLLELANPLIRF